MDRITPELVNELKRDLATGEDLGNVMNFFFREFVTSQWFMSRGSPKKVARDLEESVREAVALAFGRPDCSFKWYAVEVPEYHILHGPVFIDGKQCLFLWASDILTGILSVPDKSGGDEIHYLRLSITPAPMRESIN
jgi:hypothetical protein